MTTQLAGKRLVVVGGGSGIGREIAAQAAAAGAIVTLAGRDPARVEAAASRIGNGVGAARVDLGDEASIRALAEQVGELDYLVSLAAAHANGPVGELDRTAVAGAFDAKVIGPIMLAKHLAPRFAAGGAMLLFSGFVAWRPSPGLSVMATTNGAVSFLAAALAVELAPVRVNALSPGVVDSGAWDRMGAEKDAFFRDVAVRNPARRVGQPADIAAAALMALTNPFLTGTTLHVDGGGRLEVPSANA
ncbi:SDR family oxidoreductase [Nonomuraea sp. NPDC000554]|uniref:SDR family oxidoreductase n=1 Tax=Nonomuraea sp. NPDC000554 TaxID=3154259 RepID=UPI003324B661